MPADSLTLAVTSGFGVGIIAGIVSGVCYVLVHGFVGKRPRNSKTQWHCGVCGVQFRSIEGVLDTEKVVTCIKCGRKICKIRCSSQDPKTGWICQSCQHPESWFKGILKALHPNSIRVGASKTKMNPDRIDEIDEDLEVLKKKEKEQVRDFIERLVEAMLGSSIDNASITRIYNDKKYDIIISRYHADLSSVLTDLGSALHMSIANLPIIGESPCSAHASLKLLIQRIIQESIGLPTFTHAEIHPGAPAEDSNRTYEDLLATAILNKVIQNYQDEPTSSGNSISSRLSNSSRQNDKEYFFGEETLDTKWKNGNSAAGDVDTTSVSSLEEWVRSDSSVGSTKYIDHMSLTIQQRIEEVSSTDDEADIEPVPKDTLGTESEEWQENWKMQKRKFGGSASPVPVPMLVPNPTTEAKVLIGDRDAEDTTDLSDAGSEYGDTESAHGIETILVDSKTVIGGKNLLVNINAEDKTISEDGSTDTSDMVQERERVLEQFTSTEHDADVTKISETVNSAIIDQAADYEDTSPVSLDSHTEQDTEYTEKYATLPRTILKSPTPMLRDLKTATDSFAQNSEDIPTSAEKDSAENTESTTLKQNGHHEVDVLTDDDDQQREKFKGSYSEREKQKWNNAVEMKNNPYSPENLNRRLSSRSSDSSNASLFGRDYYIKEAAKSAGARKKLPSTAQDEVEYQTTEDKINQEPSSELASPTSTSDTSIFKAVPAIVDTDSSLQTDESSIEIASPIRPKILEISSDSDLSIERVYNLHSGKVYEKVGDANREIDTGSKSPECIKYTPNLEFDKNVEVDENHNNRTTNDRKRDFFRSLTQTDDNYSPTENSSTQMSSPTVDDAFIGHTETPVNQSNNTNNVPFIINQAFTTAIQDDDSMLASNNEASLDSKEFSLVYSTDEYDGNTTTSPIDNSKNVTADPEIVDLQDKHLVKDKLGLFSKSYPNLASVPLLRKTSLKKDEVSNRQSAPQIPTLEITPTSVKLLDQSVHNFRRKFDYEQELKINLQEPPKNKQVHSLTARSIPREFRQELKGKAHETEAELQNNSTTTPNDGTEADEPKVFPTAKSRIQFFENLRR